MCGVSFLVVTLINSGTTTNFLGCLDGDSDMHHKLLSESSSKPGDGQPPHVRPAIYDGEQSSRFVVQYTAVVKAQGL